jgi:hypothetical protein
MLSNIVGGLVTFIQNNYVEAIAIGGILLFIYSVYYVTTHSLRNLKSEIHKTYPFDLFFPSEGKWSIGYFLLIVVFLASIIYLLIKGKFYFGPA